MQTKAPATAIAVLRVVSGLIEIAAALYVLRKGSLRSAVRVNAALGLIGPAIFVTASLIGVYGLRTEIRPFRLLVMLVGVTLVLLGSA